MQIEGALIREQGHTFAVVVVKPQLLNSQGKADQTIQSLMPVFGVPVVLMAQDHRGRPTYYGNRNIVNFMATVPLHAVPWRKYTIN